MTLAIFLLFSGLSELFSSDERSGKVCVLPTVSGATLLRVTGEFMEESVFHDMMDKNLCSFIKLIDNVHM